MYLNIIYFFFFNDTATTEIYTLSLHDALPILLRPSQPEVTLDKEVADAGVEKGEDAGEVKLDRQVEQAGVVRSEEHTSELQSRLHLVCRLLLEKKKDIYDRVVVDVGIIHVVWR